MVGIILNILYEKIRHNNISLYEYIDLEVLHREAGLV